MRTNRMRVRGGLSLVEVMVAVLVMAVLGLGPYETMTGTVRGIQLDRVNEARRQLTLDLLERFAQPYSDIEFVFPAGTRSPAVRELSLDEAMTTVAIKDSERFLLNSILGSAGIKGFRRAVRARRAPRGAVRDPGRDVDGGTMTRRRGTTLLEALVALSTAPRKKVDISCPCPCP